MNIKALAKIQGLEYVFGMRNLLIPVLVVLVIIAAVATYFYQATPESSSPSAATPSAQALPTPAPAAPLPPVAPPKPESVKPEFLQFLRAEAKALDSTNVDAEAAGLRAQSQASEMGPLEFQFARDTVLAESGPAREKIMSVFLLTSAGAAGWPALAGIVQAPVSREPVAPHTEAEMKSVQERAYRLMAVDALAEQAVKSAPARQELLDWLNRATEPSLRDYIQKKISDLPPL